MIEAYAEEQIKVGVSHVLANGLDMEKTQYWRGRVDAMKSLIALVGDASAAVGGDDESGDE